ncbi:MAG: hypothetical protein U0703_22095 [Anaerolineae bacterium]
MRPWLGDFTYARVAVGAVGSWVEYGLCMVLFIAGMQNINEELYDAAKVFGAGRGGSSATSRCSACASSCWSPSS